MHHKQSKQEKVNVRGKEGRKREIELGNEENCKIPFDENYDKQSLYTYYFLSFMTRLIRKSRTIASDGIDGKNQLWTMMEKLLQ